MGDFSDGQEKSRHHWRLMSNMVFIHIIPYKVINVSTFILLSRQPIDKVTIQSEGIYLLSDSTIYPSLLSFLLLYFFHSQSDFFN